MKYILAIFLLAAWAACGPRQAAEAGDAPQAPAPPQVPAAPAPDTSFLDKKKLKGVDFYALGQEPGWSLDLDTASIFSFSSYDGVQINTPPVRGMKAMDAHVTRYHAKVEMGELDITIQQQECADIMSGQKFPYSVRVRVKRGIDSAFREYKGCGDFMD